VFGIGETRSCPISPIMVEIGEGSAENEPDSHPTTLSKNYIVGTAGHIDHGKSTLVEALTGVDPDRLPEERDRGMTIDLGFAHLPISDPAGGDDLSVGLIDVPGHADFVKNMVAGVGAIDACLIVVACDDGWMPQTEEHLQILSYLGVTRGVIALTKSDLMEDQDMVMEFLADSLKGSFLEAAPIIPTCALGDEGVDEVKAALSAILLDGEPPRDIAKPRLNVDRVFSPKGVGTVVTGTLTRGSLSVGDSVTVMPGGRTGNLRAIQSHDSSVETAQPGMRTALNLPDLSVGHQAGKEGIGRGDVITLHDGATGSRFVDVWLHKSDRKVPGQPASSRPIPDGGKVRFHLGSGSVGARALLHTLDQLGPGDSCYAQLRLEEEVYAHIGDRFVLRDWGKRGTAAGGIIIDPEAAPGKFHTPERLAYLESVHAAADAGDARALAAAILSHRGCVQVEGFLDQSDLGADAIAKVLDDTEIAARVAGHLVPPAWWASQVDDAKERVRKFHSEHPEKPSYPIKNFRGVYEKALPTADLVDPLMDALLESGFVKARGGLRSEDHLPSLPDNLKRAADRIQKALDANPVEPPNVGELTPDDDSREALQFLLDTGQVITLDQKNIIGVAGFDSLKALLVKHLTAEGQATASDLRQVLGTTRRILIPFLEAMDRQGVTIRDGDFRVLK